MSDEDNINRLLGRLEEFRCSARKEFQDLKDEIHELRAEVKALNQFKWRVAGGAGVLSVFMVVLIELVHFLK